MNILTRLVSIIILSTSLLFVNTAFASTKERFVGYFKCTIQSKSIFIRDENYGLVGELLDESETTYIIRKGNETFAIFKPNSGLYETCILLEKKPIEKF